MGKRSKSRHAHTRTATNPHALTTLSFFNITPTKSTPTTLVLNNDPLLNVQRLYSTKNNYSTSLAWERVARRGGGLARCPTTPGGNEL